MDEGARVLKTVPLWHLAELNPSTPEFDRLPGNEQVTFLPLETVWNDARADHSRLATKSDVASGYTRFRRGDVVSPKVTPTFQAGRSMVARGVGAGTTELHILRPKAGVDSRWLCYAVRNKHFLDEGVTAFQGVAGLQRVPPEFVNNFRVADYEPDEQRRIADFLDDQVARIDRINVARREQMDLLKEEASSILSDLTVAASAELRPLQTLTDPARPIQYGIVLPGPHFPGGIPIVKGGDIGSGRLARLELNQTDPEIESLYRRSRVQPGDFVIAIRGSVGEVAPVPAELHAANLTQDSARIAPWNCDKDWLHAILESPLVQSEMAQRVKGATIRGINIGDLRRVPIPVPSAPVQRRIGQAAITVQERSENHFGALASSIDLLTEYKSSLITAAVSGELDVTTAGSSIPG